MHKHFPSEYINGITVLNNFWVLISAFFVFLMQVGFLCLESGRTRSKNSINVAAKNIIDLIISSSIFWLFGFGLMFGTSYKGFIGIDQFLFDDSNASFPMVFFLFQMMFCSTAATLTSGAIAERTRFTAYIFLTIILSAFIYPVTGHWVWAGLFNDNYTGWLESRGFVDFAGSTVVHSVGGWVALSAIIVLGPRLGRFSKKFRFPTGSNLPMSAMGTLLIWFGWFGFNGGSTLEFNDQIPKIILNTFLAAIWGGLAVTFIHFFSHRFFDVGSSLNGIIAGLVAITANCHVVSAVDAVLIGIIAGAIVYYGTLIMDSMKLDDALAVIPAHLFAGIWGTIAVAIFGDLNSIGTGLTRAQQAIVQLEGIVAVGLYSFIASFLMIYLINRNYSLRVTPQEELKGLNITEHRATTELIDLLEDMQSHQKEGNFTTLVKEEPFTEVGQIAKKYNEVIHRVAAEIEQREKVLTDFELSEKRKVAILDSATDAIISIDHKGRIIEFNKTAEKTFGCLKTRVFKLNFIDCFVTDDNKENFYESLSQKFIFALGIVLNKTTNLNIKRASGQLFPAELIITKSEVDKFFTEYTLHIRDVTKKLKLQSRLNFLAYKDPLTRLSNRTHLMKELNYKILNAISNSSSVALFFLDLDKFKVINDTLGHKAGDSLLCEVANRLEKICRNGDVIARLGGDEFIVVIDGDINDSLIQSRALEILEKMREPILIEGKAHRVPSSIGISVSNNGIVSADELIQQADIAMYHAKVGGRDNYTVYDAEMGKRASRQAQFQRMIKNALEQRQFRIVYQPKVTHTGAVVSFESLIRWVHPEFGAISPDEFIPFSEENQLIMAIDEYVIDDVISTLHKWINSGYRVLPVSINISGGHLLSQAILPYIKKCLEKYDIPGTLLEIEITEGTLINDVDTCIDVLNAIKKLGISVSVDDFGTGYSSLSYLKSLPLDILKIDRSFVKECDSKPEDAEICNTVITLANSLGLQTVAEGVETSTQLEVLKGMGCNIYQGYYFYNPLDASKVETILKSHDHA